MRGNRFKQARDVIRNFKNEGSRKKEKPVKKSQEYPKKWYLWPSKRKYPIVDPSTGKMSCTLIKAVIYRASRNGDNNIANKARALYSKNCINKGKK